CETQQTRQMLGFVPQPNLRGLRFLGLTEQYWGMGHGDRQSLPQSPLFPLLFYLLMQNGIEYIKFLSAYFMNELA
ncbi:MAG: hypothetical protein ACIWVG_19700, partial [Gloeotrichia echinulata HAB0833]